MPAATFNPTFDYTFQPTTSNPLPVITQPGCRREGVYLTWLTLQGGWWYHLFEGTVIHGQATISRGQASRNGLLQHTQKETAPTMTLHTANLTEAEANVIGTIRESISVSWLIHHENDSVEEVPVSMPAGDAQLWNSATFTNNLSVTIILPSRRSQRR